MQKLIWKGLPAPFYSSSKRYQIPFCSLQKGIRYRMQNVKNPWKSKSIACGSWFPSCSLQKGRWLPLELLQKVPNQIPLRADCMRNLRIACNADNVSDIPLRKLNLKIRKCRQALKLCFIIRSFYTHESLSNHTNLRPIYSGATVPFKRYSFFFGT